MLAALNVRNSLLVVRSRDHPQTSVGGCALGERDPGGDQPRRTQAPVVGVLVPRDTVSLAWILWKERCGVHKDIWTDDLFNDVQHSGMGGKVKCPSITEVRLD